MPARHTKQILITDHNGRLAYRLKEVAEMIGVPVSTLRKLAHRGDINPVTGFGAWLITAEDLEVILQKRLRNQR